jgi:hypothetical protein
MCCTNWIIDDLNNELWNVKGSEMIRSVHVSYFYPMLLIHHELILDMNGFRLFSAALSYMLARACTINLEHTTFFMFSMPVHSLGEGALAPAAGPPRQHAAALRWRGHGHQAKDICHRIIDDDSFPFLCLSAGMP